MRPAPQELSATEAVPAMLRYLLSNGIDGGELRIQARTQPSTRVVFRKYIRAPGKIGFFGIFEPSINDTRLDANWCAQLTRASNFAGALTSETPNRVQLDLGDDVGRAEEFVTSVFENLLHTSIKRDCVAYFEGVLISNVPRLTGVDTFTK